MPKESLPTTPSFDRAAAAVRNFTKMPDNALEFYALYSFAKFGEPPAASWSAGVQERYKRAAWVKVAEEGITAVEAQERYVRLYEEARKTCE